MWKIGKKRVVCEKEDKVWGRGRERKSISTVTELREIAKSEEGVCRDDGYRSRYEMASVVR
jgi:hypothetical protein